jgi:flavodoxin
MKKKSRRIFLFIIIVAALAGIAAFVLVQIKDRTYFHSPPYAPNPEKPANVLVVYYSRSGNTEALAREIARKLEADIVRIESGTYSLDFKGWRKASKDARSETYAKIEPGVVDMSKYRLVFLGSPIWWFRPAPPLWTFVEKNDFSGKNVILFNTFNSRFKPEKIQEFRRKTEEKGGKLVDHIYIRRGRIYYQKNGVELIQEAQTLLDEKMSEWQTLALAPN